MTLYAENVTDLISAAAQLQFDPRILRINNIVAGDLPQRDGAPLQPVEEYPERYRPGGYEHQPRAERRRVSGSGGLFSMVFQAWDAAIRRYRFPALSLTASTGQPIPSNTPPPLVVNVQ